MASSSSRSEDPVNARLGKIFREGALIGWAVLAIFLLLILVSYSPADPGWSRVGSEDRILNAGGRFGAWLADVIFVLFGYLSYLFPVLIGVRVWRIFRTQQGGAEQRLWKLVSLRLTGLLLILFAGTAIIFLNQAPSDSLPQGVGGVVGELVGEAAFDLFGFTGANLLLAAGFLFGVTVFADVSWLTLFDRTGRWLIRAADFLVARSQRWISDRKEKAKARNVVIQRQENLQAETKKKSQRKKLSIERPAAPTATSERAEKEKQSSLFNSETDVGEELPKIGLLDAATAADRRGFSQESLEAMSRMLELKLQDFGVSAEVTAVLPGPVVTRFEIQPAAGTKASKITNLARDLARSLAVISVRVVEVIPGKSVVGIEIPNENREIVRLSQVISSRKYEESRSNLTLALGQDIAGQPVIVDLARMPHLLVAGTTGAGKSVAVNVMLLSLLYKSTPKDVRLILVDPKMLELAVYEGIPHLLTPVITDMKDAANGLRWCVGEMERRYRLMAEMGVRNLAGFNRKVQEAKERGEPLADPLWDPESALEGGTAPGLETLPSIVVVVDEFADMMMIVDKKKVEQLIARIAQKARAAGIHLILATQRPSVDVITGLIKANVPSRIAFQVSSRVDSRTILDQGGAEQLLGHGDMLYLPVGSSTPVRVHGAFVDDHEVHKVVESLQKSGNPQYIDGITDEELTSSIPVPGLNETNGNGSAEEDDPLYDEALEFVTESRKASISSVQRKLRIGYNRAARLIEAMEAAGVVTAMQPNGNREVLAPRPR
jgi:S-DNA-T family DNA segregation ATPase FtsK/SpoIIIE